MSQITFYNESGVSAVFENNDQGRELANSLGFLFAVVPGLPSLPVLVHTKMRRQAFIDRFPKLADGVSNKYSALDLFLNSDSYAASLAVPVSGPALHALRLLIITGTGAMSRSDYVDYLSLEAGKMTDAERFTGLLMQPTIPVEFRLTMVERTKMLRDPILASEAYKG